MTDRNDRAIAALQAIARNTADILAEQKRTRDSMDRLANSMFGLAKDMRRWFKSKTTQPALPLADRDVPARLDPVCNYDGCNWRGNAFDWYDHALDAHGRELPEWITERRRSESA